MREVSIQELKKDLSGFLRRAEKGECLQITRRKRPVARLGPAGDEHVHRGKRFGEAGLRPLFKNATGGRYLEVLAEDRGIDEDAR